jgi:hypothetical protein
MNFIPYHFRRQFKLSLLDKLLLAIVVAFGIICLAGCYGSQVQCSVRVGLFTWDDRPITEVLASDATNFTARATSGSGIGSNARVHADNIHSMVLHKSPVTASSNSTPISVDIPLIK